MSTRSALFDTVVLALCWAVFMSTAIVSTMVGALAATTLLDDPTLATLPLAAIPLLAMALAIPVSLLMRRRGRKAGFLLGVGSGVASSAICALGLTLGSFALFFAGVACLGVYQACATYYRFAVADTAPPSLQARSVSLVLSGGLLAAVVGPTLATVTRDLAGSTPFVGTYLAALGLNLLAVLALSTLRWRAPTAIPAAPQRLSWRTLAHQPRFIVAASCCGVGQAVMMLVMTATPLAMTGHGHSLGFASLVVSWHVCAMFAPSFFTGALIARFGLATVLLSSAVAMSLSALVAIAGTSGLHFAIALILNGIAWNGLFVGGSTLLAGIDDADERARLQGANEFVTFAGAALATFASGAVYFRAGWNSVNLIALGSILIVACVLVWRHGAIGALR